MHATGSSVIHLSLPFLLMALLILPSTAAAATAAETDAVSSDEGDACRIRYVQPADAVLPKQENPGGDAIRIEAGDAEIVDGLASNLEDGVRITQPGLSIEADFLTLDDATDTYTAQGSISVRQPGLLLKGDKARGSLESGEVSVDAATFLLHENRVRGSAAQITSNDRILIKDGAFTSCEPDSNAWSVEGDDITLVTESGYGTVRNLRLKIRDVPVAWFPYLRFPLGNTRQSGFLLPSMGHDSDGGTDIAIPYYFNLAPNYDLTYSLRSIWKRGIAHDLEYRYLGKHSRNLFSGVYLPDDDEYEPRMGIDPVPTNPSESPKTDRWLAHIDHLGLFGNWVSRINYTNMSDIDYLQDLGQPVSTTAGFHRVARGALSPALLRMGSLDYRQGNFSSSLQLQSFLRLNETQETQYETLPRLDLDYSSSFAGFEFDARIQASRFDREPDQRGIQPVVGSRYVFDGTLAAPMHRSWGFLVPRVDFIHRNYRLDKVRADARDRAEIATGRFSLDGGLIFERTTTFLGLPALQTLEPRLFYLYTERDFQDDLPEFDSTTITPSYHQLFRPNRFSGYDRVGDANQLSVGLSSNFSSLDTGRHLMTVGLGQIVYFKDRQVLIPEPGVDPEAGESPLFVTANANFSPSLSTRLTYEWDPDEDTSNRGFFSLKYRSPKRNSVFNLSYMYTDKDASRIGPLEHGKETNISFSWPLGRDFNLIGRWNYALDKNQTVESVFGIEYNSCCWRIRLVSHRYLEEPRYLAVANEAGRMTRVMDRRADSGVFLEIRLKGLGSLGGKLDSFLVDAIPGYSPL